MSTGLIALLDDVVAIAKVAAASLDDVAAQTVKAGTKSAGVVIDDAAVTPRYVVGFAAERELPIVSKIAWGSVKNKLLFLLPAALFLSLVAPWAITPLLMLGGAYLCYEGAEKIFESLMPHTAHAHEEEIGITPSNARQLEETRVNGAIRTDFILSAEIMAITLASVPGSGFLTQAIVLAVVGIVITVVVYGAVAIIVKADDFGLYLGARPPKTLLDRLGRAVGRGLVLGMPVFLKVLAAVGTAAMLWVGGTILIHGVAELGWHGPERLVDWLTSIAQWVPASLAGTVRWLVGAVAAAVVGILIGGLLIPVVQLVVAPLWGAIRSLVPARSA